MILMLLAAISFVHAAEGPGQWPPIALGSLGAFGAISLLSMLGFAPDS